MPGLDGEERRRVDLDHVDEPALELAVDRRLAVAELDLRHDRDRRHVEEPGKGYAGRSLDGVARLHAREDEVGALALDDLGERAGDLDRVEPPFRLDADAAVGAHREAAPHGVLRVLVPDRHDDDLAGACGLDEAERLLGRVRVPLVQREVEVVGIDIPLVFGELDFVAEDGDLLHADDDLQASTASRSITWRSRLNGSGTSGFSESISRASLCPSKMQSATSRGATQSPIR